VANEKAHKWCISIYDHNNSIIKEQKANSVPSILKLRSYQQTKKTQSERSNRVPEGEKKSQEIRVWPDPSNEQAGSAATSGAAIL